MRTPIEKAHKLRSVSASYIHQRCQIRRPQLLTGDRAFQGRQGYLVQRIVGTHIVLVLADKPAEFREALLQVLTDPVYRAQLAESSRRAHDKYFSWQRIAERYVEELQ
jgi:glycosyltransferase involved in cell wall biosynthesis